MAAAALSALIAALLAFPALAQDEPRSEESLPEVAGFSEEEALRLEALGYVDYSPDLSNLDLSGVTHVDASLAAPGHTLVVSSTECAARLIDLSGRELHYWKQQGCIRWWGAELMRNGDLVVVGGHPLPQAPRRADGQRPFGRFAARIGWAGDLVWMRSIKAHHQVDWTPSKEILLLAGSRVPAEEVGRRVPDLVRGADAKLVFGDNELVWLGADGEVRETLSLFDAVTTGPRDFDFLPRDALLETPAHVGLFHANSAYAMDQPHLVDSHPLFSQHNVLVTSRNQNRIFVVDRRERALVWEWGRGVLESPHGATWLGNAHILVFDNGTERKASRILEVDPTDGRVVWEYPSAGGVAFYSETRGLAQRLANGNTLITNSQGGQAFEVTPSGDTVWQYFAPVPAENARRPVLMSLRRYPESWVEPLGDSASGVDASVVR